MQRDVEIRELFLHIYRLASHWVLQTTEGKGGGGTQEKNITHNKHAVSQQGTCIKSKSFRKEKKRKKKNKTKRFTFSCA